MIRWLLYNVLQMAPTRVRHAVERHHYGNLIRHFPIDQEKDLKTALQLVRQGSVAIDVGANVGLWTVNLAKAVGPAGRVLAFEPIPATFRILEQIVEDVVGAQVSVLCDCVAVSDRHGTALMEVPRDGRRMPNHHLARLTSNGSGTEVPVSTLDSLLKDVRGRIGFIKIDTEGHELAVIKGADTTLREHRPILCIEVSTDLDDPATEGGELFLRLSDLHYACYLSGPQGLQPRQGREASVNYFFMPQRGMDN